MMEGNGVGAAFKLVLNYDIVEYVVCFNAPCTHRLENRIQVDIIHCVPKTLFEHKHAHALSRYAK